MRARRGPAAALVVGLSLWLGGVAGAAEQAPAARSWALKLPTVERVVFRGMAKHDAAGLGAGAMLYPAPSAAGLLAAVLTHGLLNEGAKQAQKSKLQAEADQVLEPYRDVLDGLTHERLVRAALPLQRNPEPRRAMAGDAGPGPDWIVEIAPVFSMTADQRALVLDNAVRVYAPAGTDAAFAQAIRVVSRPAEAVESPAAPDSPWRAENGRRLLQVSAELLAESLDVAMAQAQRAPPPADAPQRTFRYAEGGEERMERASLVEAGCGRLLLRTLRGWYMSVPGPTEGDPPDCPGR